MPICERCEKREARKRWCVPCGILVGRENAKRYQKDRMSDPVKADRDQRRKKKARVHTKYEPRDYGTIR